MNEAQKRAWDCLKEEERQSLFLQLSVGKSSWEAGTILNRSHYKYLEIRERAETFFRLFTDFFTLHEALFRPTGPCEEVFTSYIEALIEKRLTRPEAANQTADSTTLIKNRRIAIITRNINRLKESEDPWDRDILKLILEFDRWNNFRILPGMLQLPSAYKRRANKKDKVYIKYLLTKVPKWMHEKLIERFRYIHTKKKQRWVCLISEDLYEDGYYLLPVRPTDEVVNEMNRFYMYVFDDKEDADTFGFMVSKFMARTCEVKVGQKFWPEYRETVQKAVNYNQVNNIDFGIKSLDMAYGIRKVKPKENKHKPKGLKRADPNLFNKI